MKKIFIFILIFILITSTSVFSQEVATGSNIFDDSQATIGISLNFNGVEYDSTYRYVTDYIYCYGESYLSKTRMSSNVVFYDLNLNIISTEGTPFNPSIIPPDTYYFRTYGDSQEVEKDLFMINFGETLLPWEAFSTDAVITPEPEPIDPVDNTEIIGILTNILEVIIFYVALEFVWKILNVFGFFRKRDD